MRNLENPHILEELEPVVAAELNRHEKDARPWNPHEYIPWSRGKDFAMLGGVDWDPSQSNLDSATTAAMIVNLLTEDNLPSYHNELEIRFGKESAWGEWIGQWTAEEGRHGTALRDYLVVTRSVDPDALEKARMKHMRAGYYSGDKSPLETLAYVTMQELATRISHRNTGKRAEQNGEPHADKLLARIALDENMHMIFYRKLAAAALEIAPNEMMRAITSEIKGFHMPGIGIPDFARHSHAIAMAGIYDPALHLDEVLRPTLRSWGVFSKEDLSGDGEQARDELAIALDGLKKAAERFKEKRAKRVARLAHQAE